MKARPPVELSEIGLDPGAFHRSDSRSWRGPCPRCGGNRRFVVFTDKPFPDWWVMCDLCGISGWARILNPNLQSTPRQSFPQHLDEVPDRTEEVLQTLRDEKPYVEYHKLLIEKQRRQFWVNAGIPERWQDFWMLGFCPSRSFIYEGTTYRTTAYTIPKFGPDFTPVNIDYRLIEYPEGAGKYRPMPHLPAAPFLARPDLPEISIDGRALVVEGSKKAMVTFLAYGDLNLQVIGVPSCNSWGHIEGYLSLLDVVYILMDPDAQVWAKKKAKEIGKRSKVVTLPAKIDDAFLHYGLTRDRFAQILRQAR